MKGIVLAGGLGSRLWPATSVVSKQLLPVYDKPMIYYPLATLMSAGIRDVLFVCRPSDVGLFTSLLGDGSSLGVHFEYVVQTEPKGIAEALLLGEDFVGSDKPFALILGDNIFHGPGFAEVLQVPEEFTGARILGYQVRNPQDYGVIEFDDRGVPISIEEKPVIPKSHFAIPGLYVYDGSAVEVARSLMPSSRGELEISDVNRAFLDRGQLDVRILPRGTAWLDTGTFEALSDAGAYVRAIEARQGSKVACLEEIAWSQGWIDESAVRTLARGLAASGYGEYLLEIVERDRRYA